MPPKQNIYGSLLTGKKLNLDNGKVWENRVKTCTSYTKFGRRYRQSMRFLIAKDGDEFTLFHNAYRREYYKLPQWERKGGDNHPVEPMATETYKKNVTYDFNPWSSSDEEGTLVGYDSEGKTVFCESRLTGDIVSSRHMVVPGWKALFKLDSDAPQDEEHGRIKSDFDPIQKLYYDEDLDNDDDPYLTLAIQRRIERTKRREYSEQGKKTNVDIER
jgi:hypothetical protein